MIEAQLAAGDRVLLTPTGKPGKWEPRNLHGRRGVLLESSRAHGYARVRFDGDHEATLVHPESLTKEA